MEPQMNADKRRSKAKTIRGLNRFNQRSSAFICGFNFHTK